MNNTVIGYIIALITGGAVVWAGIISGWFQRKKVQKETDNLAVDIEMKYQKRYQNDIDFEVREKERYKSLYLGVLEENKTLVISNLGYSKRIELLEKEVGEMHVELTKLKLRVENF